MFSSHLALGGTGPSSVERVQLVLIIEQGLSMVLIMKEGMLHVLINY